MTKKYTYPNNEKYHKQQHLAKKRGIVWEFTYQSWLAWWGDDIALRGQGPGKLQMCRFNDLGPYNPNNCYKATNSQNVKDFYLYGDKKDVWHDNIKKSNALKRKPVVTPAGEFDSLSMAAKHFNLNPETIRYRIKTKPTEYYYK